MKILQSQDYVKERGGRLGVGRINNRGENDCICLLPLSDKKLPLYFGNVLTISIISGMLPAKRA